MATLLIAKGHSVTVTSRKAERQEEIETIGATAAIGAMDDVAFLERAFDGADIVHLMKPPFDFFDHARNWELYWA